MALLTGKFLHKCKTYPQFAHFTLFTFYGKIVNSFLKETRLHDKNFRWVKKLSAYIFHRELLRVAKRAKLQAWK